LALFKFIIHSPYVGADITEEIEVEDSKLEGLNEDQRHDALYEMAKKWAMQTIEFGWEEIE
jgi:hypothetical protein